VEILNAISREERELEEGIDEPKIRNPKSVFFRASAEIRGITLWGFRFVRAVYDSRWAGKTGFFMERAVLVWFLFDLGFLFFYADVYEALRNTRLDGK